MSYLPWTETRVASETDESESLQELSKSLKHQPMDSLTSRGSVVEFMSENTLFERIRMEVDDLHILKIMVWILSKALDLLFTVLGYELSVRRS